MASFEEGFRHFWLGGIHQIRGITREELRQWILHERFVVTQVNTPRDFTIRVLAPIEATTAMAHDSTRMASAAFETMLGINAVSGLPKSSAWILIRAYYAAFFAAHSLLRTFGTACVQLDHQQTTAFDHVARAIGVLPGSGFEAGFYVAHYNAPQQEIHFQKSAAARRGSHEILWETFANTLRHISNYLLGVSSTFNTVALQLSDLDTLLRQSGQNGGSWLSYVRNSANYRHDYGVWYPYTNSSVNGAELIRIVRKWKGNPVDLFPVQQSDLVTVHTCLCTILVSLCYAVAVDIEEQTPRPKSFHSYSALAVTRFSAS